MGVIESVSPIGKIPLVVREWESDFASRYLTFTIKDTLHQYMKCVAVGSSCEEFERKWYKKISDPNFKMEPVMIILHFWKILEFQGNPCLINVYGCSKVHIDPNFRGINKNNYLLNFTGSDDEDDDIFMESVESNF
ncbi:unnamed protein product [Arabidopsis thaliana]|uniref:Emb/CAB87733.1 n=1 Tax=Arabidopsis thaliana TaxID=3702 RepID=Q9FHV8_ARATH|nr:unnamed protein product [Arabidopsis thaliana]